MVITRVIQVGQKSESHRVKMINYSLRGLSEKGRRNIGRWSQCSREESESVFEAIVKETGKRGSMKIQDRRE